ncbi:hypothetical protein ABI59_02715 [Acidobacteria bacterium Mor1]|nr:hypothetical protein ABI59_02715 [Acidobacteria bacterium Mor1]
MLADDETAYLQSDLTADVLAALAARENSAPVLDAIFASARPYLFAAGAVTIQTDRRWFQTLPPDRPDSPLMVVRRWPGDSLLAFYPIEIPGPPDDGPAVSIPGFEVEERVADPSETAPLRIAWHGRIAGELGAHPATWWEEPVGEGFRLGVLGVAGDGGFGMAGHHSLRRELAAAVKRIELIPEAFSRVPQVGAGNEVSLPTLDVPPADARESDDPWQIAEGPDFTIGLPPGFRLRRLDFEGLVTPRPVEDALLWFRGAFVDRDDKPVVVGGLSRAGYVARISEPDADWFPGKSAPRGAPDASLVAGFEYPLIKDWTNCQDGRAERWNEPAFGDWVVFRMLCSGAGVEIGLPVSEGRTSLALYWVPATWREAGESPAPPPIDPAKRFGIKFDTLRGSERRAHPLTEGYLGVPGLRLSLPKDWWPVASLRTRDGFPVQLIGKRGGRFGRLERLDPGDPLLVEVASEGAADSGWLREKRPRAYRAESVHHREDGTWVYVHPDGDGFVLRPTAKGLPEDQLGVWEIMARSAYLLKRTDKREAKKR